MERKQKQWGCDIDFDFVIESESFHISFSNKLSLGEYRQTDREIDRDICALWHISRQKKGLILLLKPASTNFLPTWGQRNKPSTQH